MSPEPNTTSLTPPAGLESAPGVNGDAEWAQRLAASNQKLHALSGEIARLIDQIDRWNGRSASAISLEAPTPAADANTAIEQLSAQVAGLAGEIGQLEARLRGLEDLSLTAPRKPMRVRLLEMLIGREYYQPRRRNGPVPAVTAVVPGGEDAPTAATVRSVLHAGDAGWDVLVVGPEPGPSLRQAIESGAGRARHVVASGADYDCIHRGLADASQSGVSTVITIIHPGQLLEPTAAAAVTRFFRDQPRAMVAYFERTVRRGAWRMPMARPRRMDVYALLAEPGTHRWGHGGVFFRRRALGMVGGFKPAMRSAAQWHLYLRMARMFGLRRAAGQVVCVTAEEASAERFGEYLDFDQARQEFLGNFGLPGRLRCRVIEALHKLQDAMEDRPAPPPLPADTHGPDVELPAVECPLSGKRAERLLFTAPDARGRPCYVYECPEGLGAILCTSEPIEFEPIAAQEEPELLQALLTRMNAGPVGVRVLAVGAPAADALFRQKGWPITRLDPGRPIAQAAVTLPEAERFDVIWIGSALAGAPDPAATLRSLCSVMAPGATVAISGPNFDGPSRRRLGPAWTGWAFGKRPVVLGRAGVRELARLSDLRLRWINSRGDTWMALLEAQ